MGKILEKLFWIIPPHSSEGDVIYRWRMGVFVTFAFTLIVGSALFSASFGVIPGYSGFAKASAVEALTEEVGSIKNQLLDDRLLDMRSRQCKAIGENNLPAMRFAAEKMQELKREYRETTGDEWIQPACEELG